MAEEDDDRPVELPIPKRPPRLDKTEVRKQEVRPRDPRFDSRCSGSSDRRHFERNYAFLNEAKQNELAILQKALKKESDPEKKDKIKRTISRYRNKMIETGKDFNAKRTKGKFKKLKLADKFMDLKQTGKLAKYLERKRKKILKRDQKSFG